MTLRMAIKCSTNTKLKVTGGSSYQLKAEN
uniref:Uncharacterized protein n=1 Tax=Rhizophora mucronata TaxID=61149 RepID=A0A2P2NLU8_RHIMU